LASWRFTLPYVDERDDASSDRPVAWIADAVGYRSLANFNRRFLACKGVTRRAFRRQFAR
jgi:AraC-like DNA-binding protein